MIPVVGNSYSQIYPTKPPIRNRPPKQVETLEHKEESLSSAAFSQSNVQTAKMDLQLKPVIQPQLPKSIYLGVLNRLNPPLDGPIKVATRKEIQEAVDEKSFFKLQKLLNQTIEAEQLLRIYNRALRDAFYEGFSTLKRSPMLQGERGQKELQFFIQEGRGAESLRIYSKIRLDFLKVDDPLYHAKIKQLAHGIVHLGCLDRVPGTNYRLGEFTKEQFVNIPLSESLFIDARIMQQKKNKEEAFKTLLAASASLTQDKEIALGIVTTLQEMTSKEKRNFLENMGFDPRTLPFLDTIEAELGGPLAHYESLALLDDLREKVKT